MSDLEKSFCLNTNIDYCPINKVEIYKPPPKVVVIQNLPKNYNNPFATDSKVNLVWNDTATSPIVNLRLALSRPCGNLYQTYMHRNNATIEIYVDEIDDCNYQNNLGKQHTLFYPTGYGMSELSLYTSNSLIDEIKGAVPQYKDDYLKLNNYTLYYKPYSLWKNRCQQAFTTEEVAEQGLMIGNAYEYQFTVFMLTLITYFFDWIIVVILCVFQNCAKMRILMTYSGQFASMSLYISVIVYYCLALSSIAHIDVDKVQYFADNDCSDGVLQYALQKYNDEFSQNILIMALGLAFTLFCFLLQTCASTCLFCPTVFKKICCKCFVTLNATGKFGRTLSRISQNSFISRYSTMKDTIKEDKNNDSSKSSSVFSANSTVKIMKEDTEKQGKARTPKPSRNINNNSQLSEGPIIGGYRDNKDDSLVIEDLEEEMDQYERMNDLNINQQMNNTSSKNQSLVMLTSHHVNSNQSNQQPQLSQSFLQTSRQPYSEYKGQTSHIVVPQSPLDSKNTTQGIRPVFREDTFFSQPDEDDVFLKQHSELLKTMKLNA
eukprot:403335629